MHALPMESTPGGAGRVLVVDDDEALCDLVHAVLTDEGHAVTVLCGAGSEAVRAAVGQLEPDCVLLDGQSPLGYGASWDDAAWLTARGRRVPVVMLSAQVADPPEAREGASQRSRAAGFSAVVAKPFELDELVAAVASAVGQPVPFDRSEAAEAGRTRALVAKLEAAGARDVKASARREWASFFTPDDTLVQLYWGQRDGVYFVMRHAESGGRIEQLGRFHDLSAAVAFAMTVRRGDGEGGA